MDAMSDAVDNAEVMLYAVTLACAQAPQLSPSSSVSVPACTTTTDRRRV